MEPVREIGKTLILLGAVTMVAGALLLASGKLPFRIGRLPGDIVFEGKSTSFYFPVVTCILISVFLTLVIWLASLFRR